MGQKLYTCLSLSHFHSFSKRRDHLSTTKNRKPVLSLHSKIGLNLNPLDIFTVFISLLPGERLNS